MYNSNPYYSPEKLGLEIVGELNFSDEAYEFDFRVAWKDSKGKVFTARDSGCSCPSPFEDYTSVSDLERVTWKVFKELEREVRGELTRTSSYYGPPKTYRADAVTFLGKVYQALREASFPDEDES